MDRIVDGMIRVPNGPGLGLTINEDAFASMPYVPGQTYAEMFPDHEASAYRGAVMAS
jgi:hypothetical protein